MAMALVRPSSGGGVAVGTQSKAKANIFTTSPNCNNYNFGQRAVTSYSVLPQQPPNPFLASNDRDTAAAAAAAAAAAPHSIHLEILGAALDMTLSIAPTSDEDDKTTHPLPPSHAIKIRRSLRNVRLRVCASDDENDDHSTTAACARAQDEQMYDMATWRMYHRIMKSRRRQPAPCTLNANAIFKAKQEAAAIYTKGALTTASLSQHSHEGEPQLDGAPSSILEAAIFDLDF